MSTTFSSAPASVSREYKPFTPDTEDWDQGSNVKEKDSGVVLKGQGQMKMKIKMSEK